MKKLIPMLLAVAALAGCASQAELDAMTPEQRAYRAQAMRDMVQQMNGIGQDINRNAPRMTNCYRTVSGANCTTY